MMNIPPHALTQSYTAYDEVKRERDTLAVKLQAAQEEIEKKIHEIDCLNFELENAREQLNRRRRGPPNTKQPSVQRRVARVQEAMIALLRKDSRLTMREIRDQLGISSTSVVRYHLRKLRAAGAIDYNDAKARSIRVLQ